MRKGLICGGIALSVAVPVLLAAQSPLLAWRDPVYIAGGFAGVLGLALLLFQPVLAAGLLPGLSVHVAQRMHQWTGAALVLSVLAHVGGLWLTSPPDVVDVLLLRSPTPFALWGALALWAVLGAAGLALLRRRLGWHTRTWRRAHMILAGLTVLATALHAVQIEGTMEPISRAVLCVAALGATLWAMHILRLWPRRGAR